MNRSDRVFRWLLVVALTMAVITLGLVAALWLR
jgi:hypothetical protein